MVFMTHPEHGADNVSESDVLDREKIGWKVTSRAEWMGNKAAPEADKQQPAPARRGLQPKAR